MDRADILEKLNAGDPRGAIAMLDRLVGSDPDNADLHGLRAIALEETGDVTGAESALRQALALPAGTAIRLRNAANLASLLFETGQRDACADLLRQGWLWPHELAPDDRETNCIARLAELMQGLELHAETVALLNPVVASTQPDWRTLRLLARALAYTGENAEALRLLDAHDPPEVIAHERQALRAYLLHKVGKPAEALRERDACVVSAPPVILPRRESQRLMIGVIEKPPSCKSLLAPWPRAYFTQNFPSQPGRLFPDRYGLAGIFCGAGREAVKQFIAWQPDVVINNVTNAEYLQTGDNLRHAQEFVSRVAPQAINPPGAAASCTRQMMPRALAGIEGLITPSVRLFRCDLARIDALIAEIEGGTAYPMIVRTVYEQESRNMILVNNRRELADAIRSLNRAQFYVIAYLGQPREYGYFRRMRAVLVAGAPVIIRADYAREWIVRSRHYIDRQIYHDHPELLARANAVIVNPREELGDKAIAALRAAGQRIPLDIFGMDFEVDREGNVICFEANATMGLMQPAPDPFPYPPEANQRLMAALDELLDRVAERQRNGA